jgi:hypothetical protein
MKRWQKRLHRCAQESVFVLGDKRLGLYIRSVTQVVSVMRAVLDVAAR